MNNREIVTIEDLEKLSQEKYGFIKAAAEFEFNKMNHARSAAIMYNTRCIPPLDLWSKRSKEKAFMNFKYENEDYVTKSLIASNIAFINDESFVAVLINHNYTYGNLVLLANYFKKINKLENLDLNDLKTTSIEIKHLQRISRIMKKYFNVDDYQLIANKIVEIVVFQKELFLKKENTK